MAAGAGVVLVGAAVSPSACSYRARAPGPLTLASGVQGGVYHAWCTALARALRTHQQADVRVRTSTGSWENLRRIAEPGVFGLSTSDVVHDWLRTDRPGVTALGRLYDDVFHVVVRDDGGVDDLADLQGRRVATGAPGSGTEFVARRLLAASAIEPGQQVPLALSEALGALMAGAVDAVMWSGGVPTPAVRQLAAGRRVRLLDLDDHLTAMVDGFEGVYLRSAVAPGRYGGARPVATFATPNLLLTNAQTTAGTTGAVIAQVFDSQEEIARAVPAARTVDRRGAIETHPVPLASAALAYYRSTKP